MKTHTISKKKKQARNTQNKEEERNTQILTGYLCHNELSSFGLTCFSISKTLKGKWL
jgi:hypothetical protein